MTGAFTNGRNRALVAVLLALIAGSFYLQLDNSDEPKPSLAKNDDACRAVNFAGKRFTQCIAIPRRHRVEMRIRGSDGILYRGFYRLAGDLGATPVAFAMNGGMYDVGSRPIGYYVEQGDKRHDLNRADAEGNFYLKPNGVFFGEAGGGWQVMTTDDFAAKISRRPDFATQSGPMLLIGGKLHPKIAPDGPSLKLRNAVGVDREGRAHFVISDDPVSFGTLARFMRDEAGAMDALFLDGEVSGLWVPSSGRMDARYPLGPLIVVSTAKRD